MTTSVLPMVQPSKLDKPYLSIQETADLLSVDVKLVRKLIHSGELPHLKLGSRIYRVPASALTPIVTRGQQ